MASLPRRYVPPPMSTTASGSNNSVMPATSPAFSLSANDRSKSWGSLADSLVVKSFLGTLRQLLWVARPSPKPIVVTRRASNSSSWPDIHRCSQTVARRLGSRPTAQSPRVAGGLWVRQATARNYKRKYVPDYPTVRIMEAATGRITTPAQLDDSGILAPVEPPRRDSTCIPPQEHEATKRPHLT